MRDLLRYMLIAVLVVVVGWFLIGELKEWTIVDNSVNIEEARGIYWQGNTSAQLGDIITDMLGQPQNSLRLDYTEPGVDLCSVYELTVNAYNDSDPYQGKTLIYVPDDTSKSILFFLVLATGTDTSSKVDWDNDLTVAIPDLAGFGYQVLLKLVATNQLYQHSWS